MVKVEKVSKDAFEIIYPLFNGIPYRLPRRKWEQLFFNQWDDQDFIGYALMDNGVPHGFIGIKLSRQDINGTVRKFCNITSWVVEDAYKAHAMFLLFPILKLADYTLTDFTPIDKVYAVLKKVGFQDLAARTRVVLPLLSFLPPQCRILQGEEAAAPLNSSDQKIFQDHKKFAIHFVVQAGAQYCYCIATRVRRKKQMIPFLQLHYISNPELLVKSAGAVAARLCWKYKTAAMIIDENSPRYARISGSFSVKRGVPCVYKSETVSTEDIHSIYSELILTGEGE